MDSRTLLLPASVVIAGALVGAGLYFGLRDRRPDGMATSTVAVLPRDVTAPPPPATRPPSEPREPERRPPAPGIAPATQALIDERAAAAIAREKPRWIKECWEPSVRKSATPASFTVRVRFLFDAAGKQLDFSVADAGDPARRDLTDCMRRSTIVVAIDPPGDMAATQASVVFP